MAWKDLNWICPFEWRSCRCEESTNKQRKLTRIGLWFVHRSSWSRPVLVCLCRLMAARSGLRQNSVFRFLPRVRSGCRRALNKWQVAVFSLLFSLYSDKGDSITIVVQTATWERVNITISQNLNHYQLAWSFLLSHVIELLAILLPPTPCSIVPTMTVRTFLWTSTVVLSSFAHYQTDKELLSLVRIEGYKITLVRKGVQTASLIDHVRRIRSAAAWYPAIPYYSEHNGKAYSCPSCYVFWNT